MGRRITLTEAGKEFLPYAKEIMDLCEKSKQMLDSTDKKPAGKLTIGASESTMIYYLPEIIRKYRKKYPKVTIVIKSLDYDLLNEQLKAGEIDVAVLLELSDWRMDHMLINQWYTDQLLLVRSEHINKPLEISMLVTEKNCSWRSLVDTYILEQKKEDFKSIELPSVEATKRYSLSGLGKAMLPRFTIQKEIENSQLIVDKEVAPLGLYTAIHKDKWLPRNLEVFLELLELELSEIKP